MQRFFMGAAAVRHGVDGIVLKKIALAMLVLVTACHSGEPGADRRLTLQAGSHTGEVKKVNPFDRSWWVTHLIELTHAKLVVYSPDYRVEPMLAKNCEIAPDGRSITFYLRDDVEWHDGVPFSSGDVAFTLWYQKEHWHFTFLNHLLEKNEVLSSHALRIHFNAPYAYYLLHTWLPIKTTILPQHIWANVEDPRGFDNPKALIGCGPFIFEGYSPVAQRVEFRANPRFFAGKPAVDRLIWRQFKSYDSMLLALRSGEIDVLLEYYGPMQHAYLNDLGDKAIKPSLASDLGVPAAMVFNFLKEPMKSRRFREALACSLDYGRIIRIVTNGQGRKAGRSFVPPAYRFFKPGLPPLNLNLSKAGLLFDSLGYTFGEDGFRRDGTGEVLRLELLVMGGTRYPHLIQAAQLLAEQLKTVGIQAVPVVTEYLLADTRIFGKKDFDIYIGRFQPLDILAGCGTLLFADSPGNMGTCSDPRLLSLAEAFYSARNEEEMREAAWALQDYYAEELPGIALYHADALYPYRADRFEGWVPMSSGIANYWSWFTIRPVGH